jgi:hypothetical protein
MYKTNRKTILTCVAAALVVSPLSLVPVALSHMEIGAQKSAPNAAPKADRLDIGARAGACAEQTWPFYDTSCIYDSERPASEVRKVRLVHTDRLVTADIDHWRIRPLRYPE